MAPKTQAAVFVFFLPLSRQREYWGLWSPSFPPVWCWCNCSCKVSGIGRQCSLEVGGFRIAQKKTETEKWECGSPRLCPSTRPQRPTPTPRVSNKMPARSVRLSLVLHPIVVGEYLSFFFIFFIFYFKPGWLVTDLIFKVQSTKNQL